jgi:hypothetical protein
MARGINKQGKAVEKIVWMIWTQWLWTRREIIDLAMQYCKKS